MSSAMQRCSEVIRTRCSEVLLFHTRSYVFSKQRRHFAHVWESLLRLGFASEVLLCSVHYPHEITCSAFFKLKKNGLFVSFFREGVEVFTDET